MTDDGADAGGWNEFWTKVFLALILVWIVYLVGVSQQWRWTDRGFPTIIGIPLVALILLQLAKLQFPSYFSVPEIVEVESKSQARVEQLQEQLEAGAEGRRSFGQQRSPIHAIGWFIAFGLGVYLLGFTVTIPVFALVFSYYYSRDVAISVVATVTTVAMYYVVFNLVFNIQFWRGIWNVSPAL